MNELVTVMRKCLANTFVFYFKAHSFHWNIEGINFPAYHEFFGDLYEDLYSSIDPMAEQIRALNEYAPTGLNKLYNDATISDSDLKGNQLKEMIADSLKDNAMLIKDLNAALTLAIREDNQGLANFLADRLDKHKKHEWMLRSCSKG